MKQINPIFFRDLPNDEHFQFQIDVKKLLDTMNQTSLITQEQRMAYQDAFEKEKVALEVEQANPITKIIKQNDTFRDMVDRGFYLFVESKTMHYLTDVRESAERVKSILDHYGDLRDLNYSKESSNILSRDQEILKGCPLDLEKIGGTDWLNNIDFASNEFLKSYSERAHQEAIKYSRNVSDARAQVDPALDAIMTQINAVNFLSEFGQYNSFIDEINFIIKHYKDLVAARRGHKKATTTPVA